MTPVEQALEVGVMVVKNGGSTVMADRTFTNMLKGFGLSRVTAVWRLDSVVAGGEVDGVPVTIMRPIETISQNLARASAAILLGEQVAVKGAQAVEVEAEIARIRSLPSPHSRGIIVLAAACAGACFSQAAGGDWGALGLAGVAACLGQWVRGMLQARGLTRIVVTLVCAMISSLIAAAGLHLGISQTVPATLVGALIYMVPGIPLITGFIDLVSPKHMSVGFGRLVDAALVMLILAIAVALTEVLLIGMLMEAL